MSDEPGLIYRGAGVKDSDHGCTYRSRVYRGDCETGVRSGLATKRVEDVTTHPAFRAAVESVARLYDMQHDPAYQDTLCYPSPTSGDPVGLSFLIPRTQKRSRTAAGHEQGPGQTRPVA